MALNLENEDDTDEGEAQDQREMNEDQLDQAAVGGGGETSTPDFSKPKQTDNTSQALKDAIPQPSGSPLNRLLTLVDSTLADAGLNPDATEHEVQTSAHTAPEAPSPAKDFHPSKSGVAQSDAAAGKYFSRVQDYDQQIAQASNDLSNIGFFDPGGAKRRAATTRLQGLLMQRQFAQEEGARQYAMAHPKLTSVGPQRSLVNPITGEEVYRNPGNTRVSPPTPNYQREKDTGALYDVSQMPRVGGLLMKQQPSYTAAPDFTGPHQPGDETVQTPFVPEPPKSAQPTQHPLQRVTGTNETTGDVTSQAVDPITGDPVGNPVVLKGAGRKAVPKTDKADQPDLPGGRQAAAALGLQKDPKRWTPKNRADLAQIEQDHNLKSGTLGGSAPIPGKSGKHDWTYTP